MDDVKLEEHGFAVLSHSTGVSEFSKVEDTKAYTAETERLLEETIDGAVFVKCFDLILRKNVTFDRSEMVLGDPLLTEGPARGVHNGMD